MKQTLFAGLFLSIALSACGQNPGQEEKPLAIQQDAVTTNNNIKTEKKMKIEIWSDVMCPFCYIGKKKFEMAMENFSHKDKIEVEWKSFQLMPDLEPGKVNDLEKILVEKKGIDPVQAKAMNAQVAQVGKQVGLSFNFDKAPAVNTFNAHRFTHFAKANGKQREAGEILFRSYFTEGKNVDDLATLIQLGTEIGLDTDALKTALENNSYADDVRKDINEARQIGVTGVPFFVFDRKQAVSGAQDPATFLKALETTFAEWQKNNPEVTLNVIEGAVCTPDGKCD